MFRSLMILCTVAVSVFAQTGLNDIFDSKLIGRFVPHVADPASAGMGRVCIAGPVGSNSLFTNPALIALMDSVQISAGGRFHVGFISNEYMDEYAEEFDEEISNSYLPSGKFTHVSGAIPIVIDIPNLPLTIAPGIGYHCGFDFSSVEYYNNDDNSSSSSEDITRVRGGLNFLNLGVAFGLADYVSAGVTFNPAIGSRLRVINESSDQSSDESMKSDIKMGMKAFYTNFGLAGRPLQNSSVGTMTLGMMVRPGFTVKTEEVDVEYEMTYSSGSSISEDTTYDLEAEIEIPSLFGFGLHWQFIPTLAWAVEIQTRPFEDLKIEQEMGTISSKIKTGLDNGIAFRTGFEIQAGSIPIRTGFFFEHIALGTDDESKSYSTMFSDGPIPVLGGNFGIGIPIGIGRFDLGLTYAFLNKEDRLQSISGSGYTKYAYQEHHLFVNAGIVVMLPGPRTTTSGSAATAAPAPVLTPESTTPAAIPPVEYAPAPEAAPPPAPTSVPIGTFQIGTSLRIVTTSDEIYMGTLVNETALQYTIDVGGNQLSISKEVVKSVE